jgi:hypothetical protein
MSVYLAAKGICPRCGYAHGAHCTDCPRAAPPRPQQPRGATMSKPEKCYALPPLRTPGPAARFQSCEVCHA